MNVPTFGKEGFKMANKTWFRPNMINNYWYKKDNHRGQKLSYYQTEGGSGGSLGNGVNLNHLWPIITLYFIVILEGRRRKIQEVTIIRETQGGAIWSDI